MRLNKFLFEEDYAYTYEEVLIELLGTSYYSPFTKESLLSIFEECGTIQVGETNFNNVFAYAFLKSGTFVENDIPQRTLDILNKLYLRYGEHFALITHSEDELASASRKFFKKLCNVLDYTFEKYDALLTMYANNKSKLLDKLERTRSEEKSGESEISSESASGSRSAGSDTPQTINVSSSFDEIKGYYDRYDQAQDEATSSSEGSNSETIEATETFDPTTLMARIDEIQKQYENTMFKWVEEFDRLFIEEGNI